MKKFFTFFGLMTGFFLAAQCAPISDSEADIYEEDDSFSEASVASSLLTFQKHNFYDDPVDWCFFTNETAGSTVIITTVRPSGMKTDTLVYAYLKSTMACIGSNDNLYTNTTTNETTTSTNDVTDSQIMLTGLSDGDIVYLEIRSKDWAFGSSMNYNLSIYSTN